MQRDPYKYEDVDVLKNKLGIKDAAKLSQYENDITFVNLITVDKCLDGSKIDFDYLKRIHRHIFGDIFDWAGELRTVMMGKPELVLGGDTVRYSHPGDIEKDAKRAIDELDKIKWDALNLDEKVSAFTKHIASVWKAHPFREGNTRSVMTFACHYAEKHGFPMERSIFRENSSYTRNALVYASDGAYARYDYLEKIIKGSINEGSKTKCREEIKKSGFPPTENLVDGMLSINNRFNKWHSVKDIKEMYNHIQNYGQDDSTIIRNLVNEFKNEELKMVKRDICNELDI